MRWPSPDAHSIGVDFFSSPVSFLFPFDGFGSCFMGGVSFFVVVLFTGFAPSNRWVGFTTTTETPGGRRVHRRPSIRAEILSAPPCLRRCSARVLLLLLLLGSTTSGGRVKNSLGPHPRETCETRHRRRRDPPLFLLLLFGSTPNFDGNVENGVLLDWVLLGFDGLKLFDWVLIG